MPFRARFDCLWCGQAHTTRAADDIEGWASLCPDCLARAQENGFLRTRLRAALRERSQALASPPLRPAAPVAPSAAPGRASAVGSAPVVQRDAWYLRAAPFSRGPLVDLPWQMELDQVTGWLDGLDLSGVLVELGAGTGWWSPMLAGKGELWAYETDDAALELARQRLVAHDLRAHLHQREVTAQPEREADVVFAAFLLGSAPDPAETVRRSEVVRRWLRPGGRFVFVEVQPGSGGEQLAGPAGPLRPHAPNAIRAALGNAGLQVEELISTPSAFLMGTARKPAT